MFTYFTVKHKLDLLQDPYTTIGNDEYLITRKNKSFWIVAIPICWFLIPQTFVYHHLMIIIGSILQLILAFFCEKEHIEVLHDAVADDSYSWQKTAFLLSVECCMEFAVLMFIFHEMQWVYMITMLLIIWLPRLMFKPW